MGHDTENIRPIQGVEISKVEQTLRRRIRIEPMRVTKAEAKRRGYPEGKICKFHDAYPDQVSITETCKKCLYVQDNCGCSLDETCSECEEKT